MRLFWILAVVVAACPSSPTLSLADETKAAKTIDVLFLGDNGHHQPPARFKQLAPVLRERGIELVYTDRLEDLNRQTLDQYAGLVIFANHDAIAPDQEKALLDYVADGHGLIPLHCASFCFRNSEAFVKLVGGQFQRHGGGVFRTEIVAPDNPIMRGFGGFESWDETYVHTKHNDDGRTVLEVRVDDEGREPYTWTRTHGRGRMFYTAWGHDERTWGNPGFANLVERGIRWAVGDDPAVVPPFVDRPEMTPIAADAPKFDYVEAEVPFYPPSKQWGALADPIKKIQQPLSAEQSIQHVTTPKGLAPKLFLSEPLLEAKPIAMNWDERGRLWVCETIDYPNELQEEGAGRDRIRVYSDTNDDGVADKVVTFADKLSIPTSLAFCRGGVIVHQAPHTLFLRDRDGDDVADERFPLFTGWGAGDTHAGPSNLRYGFDNWYYGMVGYSAFDGEVAGERHRFGQGFYRFKVDADKSGKPFVSKLEFLRSTSNNSWGVGFSEEGLLFGSTANGTPSVFCSIPNRTFERVRGWSAGVLPSIAESNKFVPITENVRQVDWHGGFTAAAGHALYTARNYPREYWNRTAFVAEPTGHLTATFVLQPQGAGFSAKNSWNLFAGDDEWIAPIAAEVGPDGNVWVVDWYNIIVQHNPTPAGYKTGKGNAYEIPLRDKTHGRVYRVVPTVTTDPKPRSPIIRTLEKATPSDLVNALRSDNLFWRLHAQRLLVERGKQDVLPELFQTVADAPTDAIGLAPASIHALWTVHGLGGMSSSERKGATVARNALKHRSPGVRRAAIMTLPRDAAQALLDANVFADSDAQVRLAALLALAEATPSDAGAQRLVALLDDPSVLTDPILAQGLTAACAAHDRRFLGALAIRERNRPWNPTSLAIVDRVAEHVGRTGDAEGIASLVTAIRGMSGEAAEVVVAGLARGWPKDRAAKLADATEAELIAALGTLPAGARSQLIALGARWGSQAIEKHAAEAVDALLSVAADSKAEMSARVKAARELVDFRRDRPEPVEKLLATLGPQSDPELAAGVLEAIARSEFPAAGELLLDKSATLTPAAKQIAVRVLLSRAVWTGSLVASAAQGRFNLADLALDQKQALANHPDQRIADQAKSLLATGGGLPDPDRQKVVDELLPITELTGDAKAGKALFTKQCAKCHMHSGEGQKIGPDLTGMAVHPKHELLIHMIDPSRSVEGNYRVYRVALTDGRILSGLLASESKTTIELVDSEAKRQIVQREDIEELTASSKSLMPDGFEKQVSREDLTNLLEFLTQRGKFTPVPLARVATVVSTKGMFFAPEGEVERMVFADWSPKEFAGVPFQLVDPKGDKQANCILLYGPNGLVAPKMPKSVILPCNSPAKAIHFLSGVSGWGSPIGETGSVSLTIRLKYKDGQSEDHDLKNGVHFADYIRRIDVPESKFAFDLNGRQLRYLAVTPKRAEPIAEIELIKGPDQSAPIVMAVTIEGRE